MADNLSLTAEQTDKILQFQDLTGIEDISICRDVLQRHAWDLEVSVQDQLNMREGRPSVFASDAHTPAVVNDHSAQHIFFSPPRDNGPHSIRGLFKYVVSLVLQLCYNTIANILQFTFRLLQPDPRRSQQPYVGQDLPCGCRHRTELTGGSMISTTLVPTADGPGFLDQLMDWCALFYYVFCHPGSPDHFEIATNFPKRVLNCSPQEDVDSIQTLGEAGLRRREVLFVYDLEA
ncbi:hypothetical protein C0J52_02669 [Blattella germanica]|nr:hypothetical protein C0J52_02669 [Blattella germanica]